MVRFLRNFLDEAPEVRPWSLKFKDEWLERRFQDTYFDANIRYIRIATFLGAGSVPRGSVIAAVEFGSLRGVACRGSGIGGV
jgi:hypothetical protein